MGQEQQAINRFGRRGKVREGRTAVLSEGAMRASVFHLQKSIIILKIFMEDVLRALFRPTFYFCCVISESISEPGKNTK